MPTVTSSASITGRRGRRVRSALVVAQVAVCFALLTGAGLFVLSLRNLQAIEPGFDAVFVDADKEPMARYFDWSMALLRQGGLLLCDNAFFHGAVVDPADRTPATDGVRAFNRLAASDPRLVATAVPIRDGLVVGVKISG